MQSPINRIVAVAALATALAPAVAQGKSHHGCTGRCLPKGTPYAVEVRAVLDTADSVRLNASGTELDQCGDPDEQPVAAFETVGTSARTTFRHITLPLMTKAQLGKAYRRLGIKPQATTTGPTIHLPPAVSFLSRQTGPFGPGCARVTQGIDRDGTAAPAKGSLTVFTTGPETQILLADNDNPEAWNFGVSQYPSPLFGDDDKGRLPNDAALLSEMRPDDTRQTGGKGNVAPTFGGLLLNERTGYIARHFGRLAKHGTLTLTARKVLTGGCRYLDACTLTVDMRSTVRFRRLALYRTRRAYPR